MPVILWVLLPILVVHAVLWYRNRRALRFQLLLDVILLLLFAPALGRALVLDPVRCLQSSPPFAAWQWSPDTELQPTQSDLVLQLHPWWEEARRQLREGRVPWIAPHIGGGVPLVGNGQTGLLAPVMLPVWVLGPERGTTVMAVWKVEAAALGTFLLLAVAWRLRFLAAAVGGLAWGIGPFLEGWLLSPLAWSLAALPWVWWLVAAALRRRAGWRGVAAAGVLCGWLMGCGLNPESAAIVVGSALLAGVVLHPRRWPRLAVVAALAAVVAAILAWPALENIAVSSKAQAYRAANPNLAPLPWALREAALEQMLLPAVHGHPGHGTWHGPYPYAAGALGIGGAALALIFAGSVRRRHRRMLAASLAALAVAAVLAFRLPPLDLLLVRLPPLDRMTLPRFGLLVPWGLALWAALAAHGGPAAGLRRRLAWLLPIGLIAAGIAAGWGWGAWSLVLALSAGAAAVASLLLLIRCPRWLPAAVAAELVLLAVGVNPTAAPADEVPRVPVLARLQERCRADPGRVIGLGGVLPPNVAARYGLADLRSFDPLRPWPLARLHALLGAGNPVLPGPLRSAPPRLLGAWSVRYLLTAPEAAATGWETVDEGDGVRVWRNPFWQPEVRLAGRTVELPQEAGWNLLADDPALLTEAVVVPAGTGVVSATERRLEVLRRWPDRLAARVSCNGPCLLVLAQPWAPGWGARVDGERRPVVRTDLAGLGVVCPAGRHEAVLSYQPW